MQKQKSTDTHSLFGFHLGLDVLQSDADINQVYGLIDLILFLFGDDLPSGCFYLLFCFLDFGVGARLLVV